MGVASIFATKVTSMQLALSYRAVFMKNIINYPMLDNSVFLAEDVRNIACGYSNAI